MHPPRLNALFGAGRVTDLHCWLIPGTRLGQLKYELLKQCAQAVEDFRLQKMRLRACAALAGLLNAVTRRRNIFFSHRELDAICALQELFSLLQS